MSNLLRVPLDRATRRDLLRKADAYARAAKTGGAHLMGFAEALRALATRDDDPPAPSAAFAGEDRQAA